MGISACSVAVLLASLGPLVRLAGDNAVSRIGQEQRLTVQIRSARIKPDSEIAEQESPVAAAPKDEVAPVEPVGARQEPVIANSPEPAPGPQPAQDWHATARQAARSSIDDRFRIKDDRTSMWRQSYSIMFRPTDDFVVSEEAPVIADFHFKPEIHVVGLGFTIGSCFIGIPLAGVPVEDRTPDISVFVCAKSS